MSKNDEFQCGDCRVYPDRNQLVTNDDSDDDQKAIETIKLKVVLPIESCTAPSPVIDLTEHSNEQSKELESFECEECGVKFTGESHQGGGAEWCLIMFHACTDIEEDDLLHHF